MKKKTLSLVILSLAFIVGFNVVFFSLIGTKNPISIWVAYTFVHISYATLLLTPKMIPSTDDSDSFEYTLNTISGTYFFVTLIAACVFFYLKSETPGVSILVNAVLTVLYVVLFIMHRNIGKTIAKKDVNRENGKILIDQCCLKINILKTKHQSDAQVFEKLCQAYDNIHSSSVKSSAASLNIEVKINDILKKLETDAEKEVITSCINELVALFREREIILRAR